jgi:VanZ family protein
MATVTSKSSEFKPVRIERNPGWCRFVTIVTACYWLLLFVASHIPSLPHIVPFSDGWDKVYHCVGFAGLSYLVCTTWTVHRPVRDLLRLPHFLAVVALIACYGAIDERTQAYVHRSCELADWYADFAGGLAGAFIFRVSLLINRWLSLFTQ